MNLLHVTSEIGRLKTVLLHQPGKELENLTPKMLQQLLFDDIPWLQRAKEEHQYLANLYRQHGVEVVYLTDLVEETLLVSPAVKKQFLDQFIHESHVTSETLKQILLSYLDSLPIPIMIAKLMAGIRKEEIPNFTKRTLSDHIRDYPFVTDPMPNLYFTRDPFTVVGDGVVLGKMFAPARSRESIFGEYIFCYHPIYSKGSPPLYYNRNDAASIEGGDVMVLNSHILAVGVSERTHPAAIEKLAKQLFYAHVTNFDTVLAFDIPKSRAFMHLDTVFTQVDYDKFTIHSDLNHSMRVFELTKDPKKDQKLLVKPIEMALDQILSHYLQRKVTLIACGGGDIIASDREQWNDGVNTMAIAPGEVIVYERNHITNRILENHHIKINTIPSGELSRGRGGPRCMSMPLIREDC
jgi:arginine deiminase